MGEFLAYDPVMRAVYMFGGANRPSAPSGTAILNQTWEFRGGHWTRLYLSPSPPEAAMGAATWDLQLGATLIFGGETSTAVGGPCGCFDQTWAFNGSALKNLTSTAGKLPVNTVNDWETMAYDPTTNYVVLFGSFGHSVTWKFDNGR
jgi:hypothetical protein